jgi:histidine ammonia-lyase
MVDQNPVLLTGNDLTIEEIVAIGIGDRKVLLDPAALERCQKSRQFLEGEVAARRIIYGVNTSFGPMCNKIISDDEIHALQVNLIRSHAAGLGDPLKPYVSLAVMALVPFMIARPSLKLRLSGLIPKRFKTVAVGSCFP